MQHDAAKLQSRSVLINMHLCMRLINKLIIYGFLMSGNIFLANLIINFLPCRKKVCGGVICQESRKNCCYCNVSTNLKTILDKFLPRKFVIFFLTFSLSTRPRYHLPYTSISRKTKLDIETTIWVVNFMNLVCKTRNQNPCDKWHSGTTSLREIPPIP